MPMSVMDIGHVIVRMVLSGMFMLMRMDAICVIVSVGAVVMVVAVFVK